MPSRSPCFILSEKCDLHYDTSQDLCPGRGVRRQAVSWSYHIITYFNLKGMKLKILDYQPQQWISGEAGNDQQTPVFAHSARDAVT